MEVEGSEVGVSAETEEIEEAVDVVSVVVPKEAYPLSGVQGKVVSVIDRRAKEYCGSIQLTGETSQDKHIGLFHPINQRIPPIRVTITNPNTVQNKRVTVCIDHWPSNSPSPLGHIVKILGDIEDIATES